MEGVDAAGFSTTLLPTAELQKNDAGNFEDWDCMCGREYILWQRKQLLKVVHVQLHVKLAGLSSGFDHFSGTIIFTFLSAPPLFYFIDFLNIIILFRCCYHTP